VPYVTAVTPEEAALWLLTGCNDSMAFGNGADDDDEK